LFLLCIFVNLSQLIIVIFHQLIKYEHMYNTDCFMDMPLLTYLILIKVKAHFLDLFFTVKFHFLDWSLTVLVSLSMTGSLHLTLTF